VAVSFNWWKKPQYPKKTTDLSQITDKRYHIMYRVHLALTGFELTTFVVIGIDCTGSCISNYHIIMTMMAPLIFYVNNTNKYVLSPKYSFSNQIAVR